MRSLLHQRLKASAWDKFVALPYFILSFAYGIIVGHGYARFRPLIWLVIFFGFGVWVFSRDDGRHMQPTQGYVLRAWTQAAQADWDATPRQPETIIEWVDTQANLGDGSGLTNQQLRWIAGYPKFSPWVYSLDAFLPLVNFQQEEYWTPASGWWAKDWYLPLHITSGWVIATLFAASFTKLARHD